MKTVFNLSLIIAALLVIPCKAQEQDYFASGFNFVNAVGLESPTMLKINGNLYRPKGYKPGAITQGGMLYEGNYVATVENGDAKPASINFSVGKTSSPILLAYLYETTQPSGQVNKELRLRLIPNQQKLSGHAFYGILADETCTLQISANKQNITLTPLKIVPLESSSKLSVEFTQGNGSIESQTFTPDVPGNYLLFFFQTASGTKFSFLLDQVMIVKRTKGE